MGSKGTRYTEEQILRILKEVEGGANPSGSARSPFPRQGG